MTLPASFVNGATALTSSFAVPTTVTGTTYQEYLKFAYEASGLLYGGVLEYVIVANQQTFTTLGVVFAGVVK